MTDGEIFRRCLLIVLTYEGDADGWVRLSEAVESALALSTTRYQRRPDLAYSTLKRIKIALVRQGKIEQRKKGQHFYVRGLLDSTDVLEEMDRLDGSSNRDEELPAAPYRVGQGHLMRNGQWKQLVGAVQRGEIDLLAIPRTTKTKIGYWDD